MMTSSQEFEPVEADAAEALTMTVGGLLCRVGDKRLLIPRHFVLEASQVRKPGDRGRLVIPTWLAKNLGLIS